MVPADRPVDEDGATHGEWRLSRTRSAIRTRQAGRQAASLANLPTNFDRLNARLDAAAILSKAGVRFAIGGDGASQNHNARNITQAAGIAVANGLSWNAALEAVTLAPAEMYGVDDRIGSIEAGKRGDLVIWAADPLELSSFPEQVFIGGEAVPMESRQTLLRDRYLDRSSDRPPAFR